MIGTSFKEYVFIRTSIFLIHYFPLLLVVSLILALVIDHNAHRTILVLEILSIAEVTFYVLVYIPKFRALQKPAKHPPLRSLEERKKFAEKCTETVVDGERYLTGWFQGAPLSEIRRENVKEFFCWALLNRGVWGPDDEEELEHYADKTEELLGRKLRPGRGTAVPLKQTLDPVQMLHRPLLWYVLVATVDVYTYTRLSLLGFKHHRLPLSRFLTVFPPRPIALTATKTTISDSPISYWHLPHTSKSRRPILFVHGIGVGLYPYVSFLAEINRAHRSADDGTVGIIAVELMSISSRITGAMPASRRLVQDIGAILERHGWDRFVLASQSYGTVISTYLMRDALVGPRIDAVLLADPVVFLLHLPDVAYNFMRRPPRGANEHQLYYFASTDMGVAHTLARHFFWLENILWKEDVEGKNVTVTLGGRDLIVNTVAVGRYLTQDEQPYERFLSEGEESADAGTAAAGEVERGAIDAWQERTWKGEGLDVVWFRDCDHAQVFDYARYYKRLVDFVRAYSAMGGDN